MDVVNYCPDRLQEACDLMTEKELRLRTPLEEMQLLYKGATALQDMQADSPSSDTAETGPASPVNTETSRPQHDATSDLPIGPSLSNEDAITDNVPIGPVPTEAHFDPTPANMESDGAPTGPAIPEIKAEPADFISVGQIVPETEQDHAPLGQIVQAEIKTEPEDNVHTGLISEIKTEPTENVPVLPEIKTEPTALPIGQSSPEVKSEPVDQIPLPPEELYKPI